MGASSSSVSRCEDFPQSPELEGCLRDPFVQACRASSSSNSDPLCSVSKISTGVAEEFEGAGDLDSDMFLSALRGASRARRSSFGIGETAFSAPMACSTPPPQPLSVLEQRLLSFRGDENDLEDSISNPSPPLSSRPLPNVQLAARALVVLREELLAIMEAREAALRTEVLGYVREAIAEAGYVLSSDKALKGTPSDGCLPAELLTFMCQEQRRSESWRKMLECRVQSSEQMLCVDSGMREERDRELGAKLDELLQGKRTLETRFNKVEAQLAELAYTLPLSQPATAIPYRRLPPSQNTENDTVKPNNVMQSWPQQRHHSEGNVAVASLRRSDDGNEETQSTGESLKECMDEAVSRCMDSIEHTLRDWIEDIRKEQDSIAPALVDLRRRVDQIEVVMRTQHARSTDLPSKPVVRVQLQGIVQSARDSKSAVTKYVSLASTQARPPEPKAAVQPTLNAKEPTLQNGILSIPSVDSAIGPEARPEKICFSPSELVHSPGFQ